MAYGTCVEIRGALDIKAITGTSAGAVNAVALLDGLADGGRETLSPAAAFDLLSR